MEFAAITVTLVAPPAEPAAAAPTNDDAPDFAPDFAPGFAPDFAMDLDLGAYVGPDVLRLTERAPAGDATAAPSLSQSARRALAQLAGCRARDAEARAPECPLHDAAPTRYARADDILRFLDAAIVAAPRVLDLAPHAPAEPLARGRDHRLSSADEMRDRLPPAAPDPYFGD